MGKDDVFPPPTRLLLGPGPSMVHPRVLQAMSTHLVGHLDPAFLAIMEENKRLLRWLFGTANELTIPISGTGSAGMEACFVNLLEPDDEAVVCANGLFGQRMAEVARRCGASVHEVQAPWGRIVDAGDVRSALRSCRKPKVLAVVHAETSTGVLQPLEDLAALAQEYGALFLVDTVTSLAGHPVRVDELHIDACYSGSQKCLSAPPGLAPITFSDSARSAIRRRQRPVQSWYLDVSLLSQYWGSERVYHHTAPITMNYALLEALRLIESEGLEARWRRHRRNHEALVAGLHALGIEFASQEGHRLWTLNCVRIPEGVDDVGVRRALLDDFGIEIGGGLGPFKGRTWRIGLMGESSTAANVLAVLSALERVLPRFGFAVKAGESVAAAERVLAAESNSA
ncbi:MAG: alanine--glyoxylate aminotransferase family protein [Candidatus Binatia bacterium]|nr:alanine--glyoxylate aminotransferase family protein [Candidatus Binatia bacterium]